MKKYFFFGIISLFLLSCGSEKKETTTAPKLKEGIWRGILTLDDSTGLIVPFNFDLAVKNDSAVITIHNDEERIEVKEISFTNDTIVIKMPVFDSEFRCKVLADSLFTGQWINHSRTEKNIIPFTAIYGASNRFDCPEYTENADFNGRWECTFGYGEPDSSMAVGIFSQAGQKVHGTFLTETGDYRYLEGCMFDKYMLLSCFDGSHAFVFHAEIQEDKSIAGKFYSGLHLQQDWIARRNEKFELRNPDSLTTIRKGFTQKHGQFGEAASVTMDFVFPNLENKKVALSDTRYKNKVVIVQVLGSWCPNCMDETKFLAEMDKKYRSQGLEIIGLAFEKTEDFEKAKSNVNRFRQKYNAQYEFLITGFLPKDADKALPMLSHVMSFPTTIFIDKKGAPRKVRTGYSGPATGEEYIRFVTEMDAFIQSLLKE